MSNHKFRNDLDRRGVALTKRLRKARLVLWSRVRRARPPRVQGDAKRQVGAVGSAGDSEAALLDSGSRVYQ